MAQLRRGHSTGKSIGGHIIRLTMMIGLVIIGLFYLRNFFSSPFDKPGNISNVPVIHTGMDDYNWLPTSKGNIVEHTFYSLSYIEKYEQAEWVAYNISDEQLKKPNVKRTDWFETDPKVITGSAKHSDYKGSGYTRGHLVPAGDMAFEELAMKETFFMSNMSPQIRSFNNGIWRELEEQSRDWVYHNKSLFIVTGPVFTNNPTFFKNKKIAIPEAFYKVILDYSLPQIKAIAFYIPHATSEQPLTNYMISIDSLEKITGIDFFYNANLKSLEQLEATCIKDQWPVSDARYQLRLNRWNKE
jgi:endonuclease G